MVDSKEAKVHGIQVGPPFHWSPLLLTRYSCAPPTVLYMLLYRRLRHMAVPRPSTAHHPCVTVLLVTLLMMVE